ncbi:MAG TPA: histidine phosphatase family protein [Chloroflexi bacterium]|jgi:broad specificity phosphatase PhoE|nr:histidine phosphatase family protein [Chloroflexota bacterium]
MDIYLIRHGEADRIGAPDPYALPLTPLGRAQAARVAEQCREWDVRFVCASTMRRAQETADAITGILPDVLRWDLEELEDMNLDDLLGSPGAGHLVSTWNEDQLRLGRERTWVRVTAAWARIELYAAQYGLERVAIVSHDTVLTFLLFSRLGLDWRDCTRLDVRLDPGASCKVTLQEGKPVRIQWVNRRPGEHDAGF